MKAIVMLCMLVALIGCNRVDYFEKIPYGLTLAEARMIGGPPDKQARGPKGERIEAWGNVEITFGGPLLEPGISRRRLTPDEMKRNLNNHKAWEKKYILSERKKISIDAAIAQACKVAGTRSMKEARQAEAEARAQVAENLKMLEAMKASKAAREAGDKH